MINKVRAAGASLVEKGSLHIKWAWFLILVPIMYWAWDREPPFTVVHYYPPAAIHAGDEVRFELDVKRKLGSRCDVTISRQIRDSQGAIRPFGQTEYVSADQITALDNATPNRLVRIFVTPVSLPSGDSYFLTSLQYKCDPLDYVWPITLYIEWKFEVLPRAKVDTITIFTTK